MKSGDRYGIHRSLEPAGVLPQPAWRIDNTMECRDNEILIEVDSLNIDSASFAQIRAEANGDPTQIGRKMLQIVQERGKHHNPVTGSGGMLIGRVQQIGGKLLGTVPLKTGDRIATLVSLSLTPLVIDEILHINEKSAQVDIRGRAILFESGLYAKLPDDLPLKVSLAALDVCGAPAQTKKLVKPGHSVVVLGASGKSGLLVLKQARTNLDRFAGAGSNRPEKGAPDVQPDAHPALHANEGAGHSARGRLIAIDRGENACQLLKSLGWADAVIDADATDALAVMQAVSDLTAGEMADLTINCVNVPGTEMAAILATREEGTVYFFSMATSFTAAALGAEGVGKDISMLIGSGYTKGHADLALQLVREDPQLRQIYTERYGG